MKGTFKIIISPNGQDIKIDVGDVIGASCTTLSKVFTDLGNKTEVERKNEYFMETSDNILVSG